MSEQNRFEDNSQDAKYFTVTPRIVKYYSRSPYDFALWDTIREVAGEAGECYLSTDDLAILSGMSSGKVVECRNYWLSIGFLKGNLRKDPGYPQPVWHLSIPNLWTKNIKWAEQHLSIKDRLEFKKSLHDMKPSPHEEGPSPHETKNIKKNIKKNIQKEEKIIPKLTNYTLLKKVEEDFKNGMFMLQAPWEKNIKGWQSFPRWLLEQEEAGRSVAQFCKWFMSDPFRAKTKSMYSPDGRKTDGSYSFKAIYLDAFIIPTSSSANNGNGRKPTQQETNDLIDRTLGLK